MDDFPPDHWIETWAWWIGIFFAAVGILIAIINL